MADGYFKSGDIGTMDEGGYFRIVDRKKDMILVSGFNVFPTEREDVVSQMDGVMECACVGVPDAKTGEAVKLVIVALTSFECNSVSEGVHLIEPVLQFSWVCLIQRKGPLSFGLPCQGAQLPCGLNSQQRQVLLEPFIL